MFKAVSTLQHTTVDEFHSSSWLREMDVQKNDIQSILLLTLNFPVNKLLVHVDYIGANHAFTQG